MVQVVWVYSSYSVYSWSIALDGAQMLYYYHYSQTNEFLINKSLLKPDPVAAWKAVSCPISLEELERAYKRLSCAQASRSGQNIQRSNVSARDLSLLWVSSEINFKLLIDDVKCVCVGVEARQRSTRSLEFSLYYVKLH